MTPSNSESLGLTLDEVNVMVALAADAYAIVDVESFGSIIGHLNQMMGNG